MFTLQNAIENGIPRVLSAIPMQTICESFIKRRAIRHLEKIDNNSAAGTETIFFDIRLQHLGLQK